MSRRVHSETPRVAFACRCGLGGKVIWDARSEMLIWVDIEDPAVWRYRPATGEPLVRPKPHPANNRLNSGTIGPDGALYFSKMDDAEERATGTFVLWDGRDLARFGGRAAVTNGPVVSPDGARLYTIDTATGIIRTHTLDGDRIGEPEPFITFERGWGHPDGLTFDTEGHLWVRHDDGSRITRFSPNGAIERIVPVPMPFVTKCAFGGPDLSTLCITTALRDGDPTRDPMAGHLFTVETGLRGFAGNIFAAAR